MNFIALQSSYDDVQIALFQGTDSPKLIDTNHINKIHASKELIPLIDNFLTKHNLALTHLSFIAVNLGPGPFTTLRVVIATANGISFATEIPLIGIDALEAVKEQVADLNYTQKVIMFNGFSFDVYLLIEKNDETIFKGYKNIDTLLDELQSSKHDIAFIGNGADMYREKILSCLGTRAVLPKDVPTYSSIEQIGKMGYVAWQKNKSGVSQLLPLYLKQHPVQQ